MTEHQRRLGARLRAIRRQQDLTLHDVEHRSRGEWKAVVVGSYERGDRAISIEKLSRLADFYGVPMHDLLPREAPEPVAAEPGPPSSVRLDLTTLSSEDGGALEGLTRFARRVQVERGDYNGQVLTIRQDDLHAIAAAFGLDPDDLVGQLDQRRALVR